MIVLGLDVGSREVGIALLEVPPGAVGPMVREKAVWLERAKLEAEPTLEILHAVASRVTLVAVEPPGGVHPGILRKKGAKAAMGVSRYGTPGAKLAGRIMGHAEELGLLVVDVPATRWRRWLVGRGNAGDDEVKQALRGRRSSSAPRTRTPSSETPAARDASGSWPSRPTSTPTG